MRARDNPLATARVERIRYRLDGTTWEQLLARAASLRWRAALVGPEGAGKTTLLEDFGPRLREQGFEVVWLRLTREAPRFSPEARRRLASGLGARHCILFDGAEQFGRGAWWRFLWRVRRAGGLLITSHRPGLLPTLWECRTNVDLLAGIAADLLGELAETSCVRSLAAELFEKHRGNLRDALREWYDLLARQTSAECEAHQACSLCDN
jgi:hypothetical protein